MVMRTILRQRLPRHVLTSTTRSRVQQAPYLRSLTRFEAPKQAQEEETLEETLRKMRNDDKESSERQTSNNNAFNTDDIVRNLAEKWRDFQTGVGETWQELLQSGERQSINKRIKTGPAYTGPIDIMVIDESEGLTAWERMQKRLTEAPVISEILSRSGEIYEKSGAKQVHQRAKEVSEDAREAWETSQNPWVYRISSVYETVTADTPEALAVAELQKLDPTFNLEEWRRDVVEHTLPQIMSLFLEGKIEELSPWLGEGVYMRLAAEMKAREQEGVQINTHVLGIMNSEILACEPDTQNKGAPIIILHYMCQQINCVRKKESGEIVEGSEDDIKANSYVTAFQREYDEEQGELLWKIIDFRFNGAIAYL